VDAVVDRIADVWGEATPHRRGTVWPARVDSFLDQGLTEDDVDGWVQSACVLCSNGCGCEIAVRDGRMVGIRGRADDPVNHGRLGPKGLYGSWPWASQPGRLTRPLLRRNGTLEETDWNTAMARVVEVSRRLLDERGPLSHAFYTSGQLFLEEYYTLAVIGKAGIGTPHMDASTRLCSATAAEALRQSFGSDGQPGSYTDVEHADALFLFGHNMPETHTVLWMRVLDRTRADDPPRVVCVDPRRTRAAEEAERTGGVHLPVAPGTNLALVNGLTRELFVHDWVDHGWVAAHTLGVDELRAAVEPYTPEEVGRICGLDPDDVRRAARIFGTSDRVLSTVLQGFYQSHQATAAACGVNNLHLLRGMLGRPGAGILHMNGQPTEQNTRECGANGDLPGFRNRANPNHVQQLASLWNVDPVVIPHWAPPTHAMDIFRHVADGGINFLWIQGTNPAVSLPELRLARQALSSPRCFVVVSDMFLTETAALADVVLPAAGWGEKTGTYTNTNRFVHLSEKAVEPPGEARSDLDMLLMYHDRMGFTDVEGAPLVKWRTPEDAFDAWRECSRGRLCDYTGLSHARLRAQNAIPWPCNPDAPGGTDRLYEDAVFATGFDACQTFGSDLLTGAEVDADAYRSVNPAGRALLRAAPYRPAPEAPSEDYPLVLVPGRTLYQFQTRTKTARSRWLDAAAPEPWVELSTRDAERLGVGEGDLVRVESARGAVEARARVGRGREGMVFVPFHYGYWDQPGGVGPDGAPRAANELTAARWDPVSKQPTYKVAAVRVVRLAPAGGRTAPAPTTTASAPAGGGVPPTRGVDDAGAARSVRVDTPRYPNDPSITPDPVSLAGVARGWP
jgi:anaerobic selenocysteine-containing dehydrogenase